MTREQALEKALREAVTTYEALLEGNSRCGDPDAECPLQDCHKDYSIAGELKRLKAALALTPSEREQGGEDLQKTLEHTREWYGVRLARMKEWARALPEKQCEEFFNMLANGTKSIDEPPTWEQLHNQMRWRAEAAEAELAKLRGNKI